MRIQYSFARTIVSYLAGLAVCVFFPARATLGPSPTESGDSILWIKATQTLLTELKKSHEAYAEITQLHTPSLGTAFWIKAQNGRGRLAIVRGSFVFKEKGLATIASILETDAFLVTRGFSAQDFLFLMSHLGGLPQEIGADAMKQTLWIFNPHWSFGENAAVFTVFWPVASSRPPAGKKNTSGSVLRRGLFAVDANYTVRWTVDEI